MNDLLIRTGKVAASLCMLALALLITALTPLFDDTWMILPFSVVIISFILFGRLAGYATAVVAILAMDYLFVGEAYGFTFSSLYIIEAAIFLSIGTLIQRMVHERDNAKKELMRFKDDFLFMTVHDLRSPFAVMSLLVEKYEHGDFPQTPAEIREDITTMRKSMNQALYLIDRLRLVAEGSNPYTSLGKETIDLETVIRPVLKRHERAIAEKGLRIEYGSHGAVQVSGDALAIDEIFNNLIENAIKYNKQGGYIRIGHETKFSTIETRISDSGLGIAQSHYDDIFKPYFRERRTQAQGYGLGLYIVRELVSRMGGTIDVSSIIDEGTTFTVTLPRAREAVRLCYDGRIL